MLRLTGGDRFPPHLVEVPRPESVELDAMDADTLRVLLRNAIEAHIDRQELNAMLEAEESERTALANWVDQLATTRGAGGAI